MTRGRIGAVAVLVVGLGLTARAYAKHEPAGAVAATAGELAAAGTSWRIPTAFGAVRVWVPRGYDRDTAHVVVYVHGYYVSADRAWREHQLAEQFAASGRNAVFIACDAPEDSAEGVSWRSLPRLLEVVERGIERRLPAGPVIAIAHGGGARTVLAWLAADRLRSIVLLDTAFVPNRPFTRWSAGAPARRLVTILARGALLPTGARPDVVLDEVAALVDRTRSPDEDARRTYVRTSLSHRELATAGRAIPLALRALAPALSPPATMVGKARRTAAPDHRAR